MPYAIPSTQNGRKGLAHTGVSGSLNEAIGGGVRDRFGVDRANGR